jgi:Tol biopolymer transport system component
MPKFSPDGSRIAFASNRNGNWDIFVMPSDGGRAVQVTDTTAHELHPSWSPDGTRLTFCRLGGLSGHWEMWVTDAGNAGLSQFIGYGMFPEWCPVSGEGGVDRILFQRSRQRGDRSFAVWTIDLVGGDARNATEIASSATGACINPAWSPDGRWITYATVPSAGAWIDAETARPPSAELWMADLNGAARVKLTSGGALALMPTWGTDRIYFVSDRGGTDNIWSLDARSAVELAAAMIAPANTNPTDMANVPDQPAGDPGHE